VGNARGWSAKHRWLSIDRIADTVRSGAPRVSGSVGV
jgi:hypothetical protein